MVTSWKSVRCNENTNHIALADGLPSFQKLMTGQSKSPGGLATQISKYITQIEAALPQNAKAIELIKPLLGSKFNSYLRPVVTLNMNLFSGNETRFDVVISSARMSNEIGYYLAHKSNATLVLFSTHQQPFPMMNWGLGQPNNPAYTPFIFSQLMYPMSFMERVKNTLSLAIYQFLFRDIYVLSKLEDLLDEHFPEDPRSARPSILELENKAAMSIDFGHPLILDGLRPKLPTYIHLGMAQCSYVTKLIVVIVCNYRVLISRVGKKLPRKIQDFIKSADQGVILVSFGTVLQAASMPDDFRIKLTNVFKCKTVFTIFFQTINSKYLIIFQESQAKSHLEMGSR